MDLVVSGRSWRRRVWTWLPPRDRVLTIVGKGPTWLSDLEKAPPGDIMAVNEIATALPEAKHLATMEPWSVERAFWQWPPPGMFVHALNPYPGVHCVWRIKPCCGGSGFLAAVAGMALGYRKIVLAGVGLDDKAHARYVPGWEMYKTILRRRIRSYSGNTRKILGYPTDKWLAD